MTLINLISSNNFSTDYSGLLENEGLGNLSVNISGFVGQSYTISITALFHLCTSVTVAVDSMYMNEHDCSFRT